MKRKLPSKNKIKVPTDRYIQEDRGAESQSFDEGASTGLPKKATIIVVAGGTGGHLFPAIAAGEEFLFSNYNVHLITDLRCKDYITPECTLITHVLDFGRASGNIITRIKSKLALFIGIFKSIILLRKIKPLVIIGFGGYPSFPPLLAAIFLGIPIVIHEPNSFLGQANKFFARFAKIISFSFENTKNITSKFDHKLIITGDIIRKEIKKMKSKLDFEHEAFRIFIFGGSQSAKAFSVLIPEAIGHLIANNPNIKLEIIQQAASIDHHKLSAIYDKLKIPHKLSTFFHNMPELYDETDLVISRSGASTIAELTYIGQPAIYIPFPFSRDNHQYHNAKAIERIGGGWCFVQNKTSAKILSSKILELINNRNQLLEASLNLRMRKKDGSKILLATVEKLFN